MSCTHEWGLETIRRKLDADVLIVSRVCRVCYLFEISERSFEDMAGHQHIWKAYDSGWTKYDYCDCGAKKAD